MGTQSRTPRAALKVSLTKVARQEIANAAEFFENRKEGFGEKFNQRVDEALDKIELNPEGFQKIYKNLRHVQLEQFKEWGLFFRIEKDGSVVIACLSGKRHPSLAQEREAGVIPIRPPQP